MCQVIRNKDGSIKEVLAANGKSSKVFEKLRSVTIDEEIALRQYAEIYTTEFMNNTDNWNDLELDSNGEPKLEEMFTDPDMTEVFGESSANLFEDAPRTFEDDRPKYQALVESYGRRIFKLNKEKAELKKQFKEEHNVNNKANIQYRINSIDKEIKTLEKRIELMSTTEKLEVFKSRAKEDAEYLRKMFAGDPSFRDLDRAKEIIDFWKLVTTYNVSTHPVFDSYELSALRQGESVAANRIREDLSKVRVRMETYENQMFEFYRRYLEEKVKETFGDDTNFPYDEFIKDINEGAALALDISQSDNALLQAVHEWIKKANWEAKTKAVDFSKKVDKVVDAMRSWASSNGSNLKKEFNKLRQTFSEDDSRQTGNLVSLAYQEWYDFIQDEKIKIKNSELKYRHASQGRYFKELSKRAAIVDVSILELVEDEDAKIRSYLGNNDVLYDIAVSKSRELREQFEEDKEAYFNFVEMEYSSIEQQNFFKTKWLFENDPDVAYQVLNHGYLKTLNTYNGGMLSNYGDILLSSKYIHLIPTQDKDIDPNFMRIYDKGNEPLRDVYELAIETIETINDYFPSHKSKHLQFNTLPYMSRTFLDELKDRGLRMGALALWQRIKKSYRIENESQIEVRERDPNGEIVDNIQIQHVRNGKAIRDHIKKELIRWELKHENAKKDKEYYQSRGEVIENAKREKSNELAEGQTFDIGQAIKAYGLFGMTYKHKTAIEDAVRASGVIVDSYKVEDSNRSGRTLRDRFGGVLGFKGKGPKRLQSQFREHLDSFYGYREPESATVILGKSGDVMTKEEKEKLEELTSIRNHLLKIDESEKRTKDLMEIERQMEEIGGKFKAGAIVKKMLRYARLMGMGWNVPAGFVNLLYGTVSGLNQAQDGRIYGEKEYLYALRLMLNSTARSASAHTVTNDTAKKIRYFMDHLDVLQQTKYEIFVKSKEDSPATRFGRKIKFLNPYNVQARSEYFIQGADMIAVAKSIKATNSKGENSTLWDIVDSGGNVEKGSKITTTRGEMTDPVEILNFWKQRTDKVIRENHGNYDPDSPVIIKRRLLGQVVSMFRSWLYEGWQQRFGKERYDHQLGFVRKGRFRSGVFVPGLPLVISYSENTGQGWFKQSLFATWQSWKKIINTVGLGVPNYISGGKFASKTAFEDKGYSEIDAANFRRNIMDVQWQMLMIVLFFMFKGAADEEKEDRQYWQKRKNTSFKKSTAERMNNYLANTAMRVFTDLTFYSNIVGLNAQAKNLAPVGRVIQNAGQVIGATINQFGSEDKATFQNGPWKGSNKLSVRAGKMIPLVSMPMSAYQQTDKIYKTPVQELVTGTPY